MKRIRKEISLERKGIEEEEQPELFSSLLFSFTHRPPLTFSPELFGFKTSEIIKTRIQTSGKLRLGK